MLAAASALLDPVRPCFQDPESSNVNRLNLISFRLAQRAYAVRESARGRAVFAPRQIPHNPAEGAYRGYTLRHITPVPAPQR